MLLLTIPPVNVTLYTTISQGGHGEALIIGNLLLVQALRMGRKAGTRRGRAVGVSWPDWGFGPTV